MFCSLSFAMPRKAKTPSKRQPVVEEVVNSDFDDESEEEQFGNVAWGQKREEYHGRDVSDESSSDDEAGAVLSISSSHPDVCSKG